MKKFLALALTALLALGGSGAAVAVAATTEASTASDVPVVAAEQHNLYLVPGTYVADGQKKENVISSGAQKLSKEQCDEIYLENAYMCTLSEGQALPVPTSQRVDKNGAEYTFNGWWTIVDATITYFDKVPALSETTCLYADWRADLSQRMDPVMPDPEVEVEPNHYMLITHASNETEKITLRKSGTDVAAAEDLGYGYPVQLYALSFTLNPGDTIIVYTTGLTDSEEPIMAPYADSKNYTTRYFTLEAKGDGSNDTASYLQASGTNYRQKPTLTYLGTESATFNIYIKFLNKGNTMLVYMEPPMA